MQDLESRVAKLEEAVMFAERAADDARDALASVEARCNALEQRVAAAEALLGRFVTDEPDTAGEPGIDDRPPHW
ncbi:MAG: SlyX family protein [Planctomycetota bacterium]